MSHDSLRVSKAANMTFLRSGPDTFSITQRARDGAPLAIQSVFGLCPAALSLSSHGYRRTMWSKAAAAIDSMNAALPLLTQRPLSVIMIFDVVVRYISSHVLQDLPYLIIYH